MNFLKMLVLTLNSCQFLRYNRLKLRFLFFLNANFSGIPGLNGLSKRIVQKKKIAAFESFCSFSKDSVKQSKFKTFTGSLLTLSVRPATGRGTGDFRGQIPLSCTHEVTACKRPRCLKQNLMNFLKMLVLNLNSW